MSDHSRGGCRKALKEEYGDIFFKETVHDIPLKKKRCV